MDPREADRRRGDRRQSDRRSRGRRADDAPDSLRSVFDPGWLAGTEALAEDSRLLDQQARRMERTQGGSLTRVYRTYAAARAVVGLGLVLVHGLGSLVGLRPAEWMVLISLAYAAQAVTLWLLPRFGQSPAGHEPRAVAARRRRQWLSTIGVDLLAFSLLHLLEGGGTFNFAALLVLPVLMAGVLTSRLLALATASGVALVLLVAAWRAQLGGDAPVLMLQSGLAGLGLFLIALLAGELAVRLAREELAARGSLLVARQQAQLNRLVIEEMADGVMVIDRGLTVRAANPAARALLVIEGLCAPAPFPLDRLPAWGALLRAAQQALSEGRWPEEGRDVALAFSDGQLRMLRLRVRFMRGRGTVPSGTAADAAGEPSAEPAAVLLLEDLRTLQARIRQEKLAAMGRVSAGIAHEIRNPLAAIAQANALMREDSLSPAHERLAAIVADNVERLKRLVDDVMEISPGAPPEPHVIDASTAVAAAAVDWARTAQLTMGAQARLHAEIAPEPLGVDFDPEHLRRVLVNLLDNALRHASGTPGSIRLRLAAHGGGVRLSVASDGPPIAPEVERRLFEPFFSTRSRGTGLGLYICRELCERYGASIEYRSHPATERLRNEFVVGMPRAPLQALVGTLPLGSPEPPPAPPRA